MDHGKFNLKLKTFNYYEEKYNQKLLEPNCLLQPLNVLCGGWSLQTFKQVANKLSTNKLSPLPLLFPNIDSMELISKNKKVLKELFKIFDTRNLSRVDASEVYCAFLLVSKGSYEIFLKTIIDIFGFEFQGRITKDEFFFFLDCLFRAIPKIVIIKGFNHAFEPNTRLEYEDINKFVKNIFSDKTDIDRNEIYEFMLKEPALNEFIKYIQKKCTNSAEKYRNQVNERIAIEAEVKACLNTLKDQVENRLKN